MLKQLTVKADFQESGIMGDNADSEGNLIHSILNDLKVGFFSYFWLFFLLYFSN